jgi:hypothetical protein
LDDITPIFLALEQDFNNAARAIGWVGTTGWGEQAVLHLNHDAAVWAMRCFPMSTPIERSIFSRQFKAQSIPSKALNLLNYDSNELYPITG